MLICVRTFSFVAYSIYSNLILVNFWRNHPREIVLFKPLDLLISLRYAHVNCMRMYLNSMIVIGGWISVEREECVASHPSTVGHTQNAKFTKKEPKSSETPVCRSVSMAFNIWLLHYKNEQICPHPHFWCETVFVSGIYLRL